MLPSGNIFGISACAYSSIVRHLIDTQILPALTFGLEGRLLPLLERRNVVAVTCKTLGIVGVGKFALFDLQRIGAVRKRRARLQSVPRALTGKEADLVEEPQQPWLPRREHRRGAPGVPHLDGAAEQLIAARPFHAVDAHIGAADADGIFRRPGAGRIVLRRDQPMARIDGRRDRRAEIDVAQAEHEIAGIEHDPLDIVLADRRPLMRRMNSMFDGHQGAFGRTSS